LRHDRATEEIRELAALYALGSLTQHEARSFELHMQEGCPVCEEEFRKFEHIVAEIGFAVEEAETPDYIRELLLARAEREPQAPSNTAAARKIEPEPPPRIFSSATFAKPVKPKSGSGKSPIFAWILSAIFAALAILAGYQWKLVRDANTQLQAKASASLADVGDLQKQLSANNGKAGDLEHILAALAKPGTRIARLTGQPGVPSAPGAMIWDTEQKRCLLFGFFAPAPEGKAYQLWFVTPTARVSAGLVKNDPEGHAFITVPVPGDATDAAAVLVTLEPDNGSQIPTMPFYALGRFN